VNIKQEFYYRNQHCVDVQSGGYEDPDAFEVAYKFLKQLTFNDISEDGREVYAFHPNRSTHSGNIKFSVSQAAMVNVINPPGVGKARSDGNAASTNFALYIKNALKNYLDEANYNNDYKKKVRIYVARIFKYSGDTSHLIYALLVRSAFRQTNVKMENVSISVYLEEMPLSYRTMLLYNDPDLLGEGGINLFINKLANYESLVTFKIDDDDDTDFEPNPKETYIYALNSESWIDIFNNEMSSLDRFCNDLPQLFMQDYLFYIATDIFVHDTAFQEGKLKNAVLLFAGIQNLNKEPHIVAQAHAPDYTNRAIYAAQITFIVAFCKSGQLIPTPPEVIINISGTNYTPNDILKKLYENPISPFVKASYDYILGYLKGHQPAITLLPELVVPMRKLEEQIQGQPQPPSQDTLQKLKQETAKVSYEILKINLNKLNYTVAVNGNIKYEFMKRIYSASPNPPTPEPPVLPDDFIYISSNNNVLIKQFHDSTIAQMTSIFGSVETNHDGHVVTADTEKAFKDFAFATTDVQVNRATLAMDGITIPDDVISSPENLNCKIDEVFSFILKTFKQKPDDNVYKYLFWRYYDLRNVILNWFKLYKHKHNLTTDDYVTNLYHCYIILKFIRKYLLEVTHNNIIKTQGTKRVIHNYAIGIKSIDSIVQYNVSSGIEYSPGYKVEGQQTELSAGIFKTTRKKGSETPFSKFSELKTAFTRLITTIESKFGYWGLSLEQHQFVTTVPHTSESQHGSYKKYYGSNTSLSKQNYKTLWNKVSQVTQPEGGEQINLNKAMTNIGKDLTIKKLIISIYNKLSEFGNNIATEGTHANLFTTSILRKYKYSENGSLIFTEKYLKDNQSDISTINGLIILIQNLKVLTSAENKVVNAFKEHLKRLIRKKQRIPVIGTDDDNTVFSWVNKKTTPGFSGEDFSDDANTKFAEWITKSSKSKRDTGDDATSLLLDDFKKVLKFYIQENVHVVPQQLQGGGQVGGAAQQLRLYNWGDNIDDDIDEDNYYDKSYLTSLFYQAWLTSQDVNDELKEIYKYQAYVYAELIYEKYTDYYNKTIIQSFGNGFTENSYNRRRLVFFNIYLALLSPCQRVDFFRDMCKITYDGNTFFVSKTQEFFNYYFKELNSYPKGTSGGKKEDKRNKTKTRFKKPKESRPKNFRVKLNPEKSRFNMTKQISSTEFLSLGEINCALPRKRYSDEIDKQVSNNNPIRLFSATGNRQRRDCILLKVYGEKYDAKQTTFEKRIINLYLSNTNKENIRLFNIFVDEYIIPELTNSFTTEDIDNLFSTIDSNTNPLLTSQNMFGFDSVKKIEIPDIDAGKIAIGHHDQAATVKPKSISELNDQVTKHMEKTNYANYTMEEKENLPIGTWVTSHGNPSQQRPVQSGTHSQQSMDQDDGSEEERDSWTTGL
jgi:hypothetical protein